MSGSERTRTDSVHTVEILRDTIVSIEADSSLIRALIECDSLGQAHIRQLIEYKAGERLPPPSVSIKDNVLTATSKIDSLAIYMQLKDRYTESVKRETEVITKVVEVNHLTWWQTLWYRLGQIAAAVTAVVLTIKIIKYGTKK